MISTVSAIAMAKTVSEGLKSVRGAAGDLSTLTGATSLIDVSQAARVEPLLMVDADVMDLEYIGDAAAAMHSLFSGYYLQAIEHVANIGGIRVADKLAPLNPNQSIMQFSGESYKLRAENYALALPTSKKRQAGLALESDNSPKAEVVDKHGDKGSGKATAMVSASDVNKAVAEGAALSVGKVFAITLREGAQSAVINVAIRLIAATMPTSVMVNMFSLNNVLDNDLKHRMHGVFSGRLQFWKDFVFCNDLIEKSRNTMIKDKTGIYTEIVNRQNKAVGLAAADMRPTMAMASNLAIISSETMENIEYKMLGDMKSAKVRKAIFDNTNLMILAVIDKGYERVTFYHRGIDQPSEMSKSELKAAGKGGGDDVTNIMKAFLAGKTP